MIKLPNNYTVQRLDESNWTLEHHYKSDHRLATGEITTKRLGYYSNAKSAISAYLKTAPYEEAQSVADAVNRIEELSEAILEAVK